MRTTDIFTDAELAESRDRLKRSGAFVLLSPKYSKAKMAHADSAVPEGWSLWGPDEMLSYVMAKPKARRLIYDLKMIRNTKERLV